MRDFAILSTFLTIASLSAPAAAQNNPVPQIVGPVHPDAVAPGSGAFTLSVYGANFVPGAVVNWNYQPRATTFVSAHAYLEELAAQQPRSRSKRRQREALARSFTQFQFRVGKRTWRREDLHDRS